MTALVLLVLTSAPDAGLSELLERVDQRSRTVEAFTNDASLTLSVVSDELDAEGSSTKHSELTFAVTRKDGRAERSLLSATEDGKDVSRDERFTAPPKGDRERSGSSTSLAQLSPFHREQRAKYTFAPLPSASTAPDLVRVSFQPVGEKSDKLMIGDATIDPVSGELLSLSMRPSKNPRFVDQLYVELEFAAPTPAGRALSRISMKGRGGVLFLKKRFVVVTTFSDYRVRAP